MPAIAVNQPFPLFSDQNGSLLNDAYIYFGVENLEPIANPITVYIDEELTVTLAQPIRTIGGYPVSGGTPKKLYVGQNYSIKILDKNGAFVFASPSNTVFVQSDDVQYTQSGTGAVTRTIKDKAREFLSIKDFGGVGDGITNDTAAFNAALAEGSARQVTVDGGQNTFAVSGTITLPQYVDLRNIKIKQLSPNSATVRTLYASALSHIYMENVSVNKNGNGSGGSISDSAGIWISATNNIELKNIEVYGNDYGNGIAIIDCNNADLTDIYVHDMRGGTSLSPAITDDQIQGIWIQRGTGIRLKSARVVNLTNQWSGQSEIAKFTRGISIGGAKRFEIIDSFVDNVDQGIDITGDENPEFFNVIGGIVSNCYTWGIKCANSVQNGNIVGVTAYRCGSAGFVASAPSSSMSERTQDITYTGCRAIQTGYGGVWSSLANVSGFRTMNSGTYTDYPRGIKYIGCDADGSGGEMKYGFFNDAILGTTNGESWNEVIRCSSKGSTIQNFYGFSLGFAAKSLNNNISISSGSWVTVNFDNTIVDKSGSTISQPASTLAATRSGLYLIHSGISWAGNATATRGMRFQINGGPVSYSQVRIVSGDANQRDMVTSVVLLLNQGDLVTLQVYQDTGSNLNLLPSSELSISLINQGQS